MIGDYKIIALCTCRIQDKESHNFIARLNEKLVNIGCRLFIFNTCWVTPIGMEKKDSQLSIYELIDNSFIDAVIIQTDRFFNENICKSIVDKALEANLPVVSLGISFDKCINIQYNHQKGFKEIIEHLIFDHNIRNFHLIAGLKGNKYSEERISVFKETLEENNIEFNDSIVSYGDFWPLPAKAAVQRLIDENRLPKAFVCSNDNMAIAVTELLKQNSIRVPEDIVVTGFDCIDAIYSSEPTITSAYISSKISAQVIFDSIYDIFYNNKKEGTVSLDAKMVINDSCGCKNDVRINLTPYLNEQVSRFCQYQDDDIILAEFGAKLQQCNTIEDVVKSLDSNKVVNSMCCLLKNEYMDETKDPVMVHEEGFSHDMFLLYDSDSIKNNSFKSTRVSINYLIPNIEKYLADGRSLIFTALHYLDVPFGYVCFYFEHHEISNYYKVPQIVNSLNNGLGGLRNIMHRQYLLKYIEQLYKRDALTGLYNRRGFISEYEKILKRNKNTRMTVVMCDLDGLKQINDNYGHEEGDIAIQKVAEALKYAVGNNSISTRFGGDEMLSVVIGDLDDDISNKVDKYLDEYNKNSNKEYKVSCSIGIYKTNTNEALDLEELIKCSDKLMYQVKEKKKKR